MKSLAKTSRKSVLRTQAEFLTARPLRVLGTFISLLGLTWWLASQYQVECRFSADIVVSELQFTTADASGFMPSLLTDSLDLEGFETVSLPWGRLDDETIVDAQEVEGFAGIEASERCINLSGIDVSVGTRVLTVAGRRPEEVAMAFREPQDPEVPSASSARGRVSASVGGRAIVSVPNRLPRVIDFGTSRGLKGSPSSDSWRIRFNVQSPRSRLLYPALAVSDLDFRITDDLSDPRERGRLDGSSVRSGVVRVHKIDGGQYQLYALEELNLDAAKDLLLDRVERVREGMRISFTGRAETVKAGRKGEMIELIPNRAQYSYRTESGRLALTLLFGFVMLGLEFFLDLAGERGKPGSNGGGT